MSDRIEIRYKELKNKELYKEMQVVNEKEEL